MGKSARTDEEQFIVRRITLRRKKRKEIKTKKNARKVDNVRIYLVTNARKMTHQSRKST